MSTRINLEPVARAITTAMLCVMAENAGAQQFGDAEEGRQLARENCAECHAIDNGTGAMKGNARQDIIAYILSLKENH